MRKNSRYSTEFKQGAVSQVTEEGHAVMEVSRRLGILVLVFFIS